MSLRGKLETIKGGKEAEAEAAQLEAQETAQRSIEEAAELKQQNFLDAHKRKSALAKVGESVREARKGTTDALGRRKDQFKNIKGLMEEIKAEDPTVELSSFKEVVADPEEGSDEERYAQSKERVREAIAKLRNEKDALKTLGVDSKGLSDEELMQAVEKAQGEADVTIKEFLLENPKSELPEAAQERAERIAALEKSSERLKSQMKENLEWGKAHVTEFINQWDGNPEVLPAKIREGITEVQGWIDSDRLKLTKAGLYRDILDGVTVMADPEVAQAYAPINGVNEEVRILRQELDRTKSKPTAKLFGYTEKKKQEDLARLEAELKLKEETQTQLHNAYDEAAERFLTRYRGCEADLGHSDLQMGGFEKVKAKYNESIATREDAIALKRGQLRNAEYYAKNRRELMDAVEANNREIAALKGE